VARELTKLHEEVWRGTLGEAVARFGEEPPRGEITVVIAGRPTESGDVDRAVSEVSRLVEDGMSFSDAVRRVAHDHGVRRRELYEASRGRVGGS
jgi:16S rRNA (cytidine1402-2'-O)-methyltransferase